MITFFHKGNLDIPRIYWCARKLMRYDISFLQVMLAAPINLNVCLPSNAYPKHGLVMVKMIAEIFLINNIVKVRKYFFTELGSDRLNMGNNGMSEQGRIFSRNKGSFVGSSYKLLKLKKPRFFIIFCYWTIIFIWYIFPM